MSCDHSHYLLFLVTDVQQEAPEHEQILNIMSYAQRGRMDEQRCSLNPVKTGQIKTTPAGWDSRSALNVSCCRMIVDCFPTCSPQVQTMGNTLMTHCGCHCRGLTTR